MFVMNEDGAVNMTFGKDHYEDWKKTGGMEPGPLNTMMVRPLYAEYGIDDFRGHCPTTTGQKLTKLLSTKMVERKRIRLVVGLEDFNIDMPADDLFDLNTLRNQGAEAAAIADQVILRIPGRPDTILKDERSTHINLSAFGRMAYAHFAQSETLETA
jgi:hypothetical protein